MIHPINLAPERDALDGRQLEQLVRLWLQHCRARLPSLTVDGYEFKINYFVSWWRDVGRWSNWELSEQTMLDFVAWLDRTQTTKHKSLSYNSKKDILRRLRQCLHWACTKGHTGGIDFSLWVPQPNPTAGGIRPRVAAQSDDLQLLLDAAHESPFPERDQAILAMFIQTGIRRGECASITVQNIDQKPDLSGTVLVVGKRTKARPTGERIVAFDALCGAFLAAHLRPLGTTSGPAFCGVDRAGLTPQGIYKVVKRAIVAAGLEKTIVGPHDLRRAFITDWRRRNRGAGFDHLLRLQVGHTKDSISDIYDLAGIEDLSGVISGPLSHLRTLPT
jgi:integrase